MLSVDFIGSNIELGKPADMSDEQCHSVRAMVGIDEEGLPFTITAWQPNYEDLQALNAGRPLMLHVVGGVMHLGKVVPTMPPVALYTFDADTNPNF